MDPGAQRLLAECAAALHEASRRADTQASRIGVLLGGSGTGADREMAAELRVLTKHLYDAGAALNTVVRR
jgi:hypothetical protein